MDYEWKQTKGTNKSMTFNQRVYYEREYYYSEYVDMLL